MQTPLKPAGTKNRPGCRAGRFPLRWSLLLAAALIVVLAVGFFFGRGIALKLSTPYRLALEQVTQDRQVVQRLGQPIEAASLLPAGSLNRRGGSAILYFAIRGPKGEADVSSQARRIGPDWGLITLEVTFDDGRRISLDTRRASRLPEAPKWSPPPTATSQQKGLADKQKPPEGGAPAEPELDTQIKIELPLLPKPPAD